MPRSAVRKSRPSNRGGNSRHKKVLLLPMRQADADDRVLPVRIAFERIRLGKADRAAAVCMAEILLLTGFLTEDGFGCLDSAFMGGVEMRLLVELNQDREAAWRIDAALIADLGRVVNEYDRLIRETRLQAIMAANENFARLKPATPTC